MVIVDMFSRIQVNQKGKHGRDSERSLQIPETFTNSETIPFESLKV
jgi:hypothetical protein